jgi:hypothetical protein
MKKIRGYFLSFVFTGFLSLFSIAVNADPPNPPVVPGRHGQGGNITGAPIDNMGLLFLIVGTAYAGWMLYKRTSLKKKEAGS